MSLVGKSPLHICMISAWLNIISKLYSNISLNAKCSASRTMAIYNNKCICMILFLQYEITHCINIISNSSSCTQYWGSILFFQHRSPAGEKGIFSKMQTMGKMEDVYTLHYCQKKLIDLKGIDTCKRVWTKILYI